MGDGWVVQDCHAMRMSGSLSLTVSDNLAAPKDQVSRQLAPTF